MKRSNLPFDVAAQMNTTAQMSPLFICLISLQINYEPECTLKNLSPKIEMIIIFCFQIKSK